MQNTINKINYSFEDISFDIDFLIFTFTKLKFTKLVKLNCSKNRSLGDLALSMMDDQAKNQIECIKRSKIKKVFILFILKKKGASWC